MNGLYFLATVGACVLALSLSAVLVFLAAMLYSVMQRLQGGKKENQRPSSYAKHQ